MKAYASFGGESAYRRLVVCAVDADAFVPCQQAHEIRAVGAANHAFTIFEVVCPCVRVKNLLHFKQPTGVRMSP